MRRMTRLLAVVTLMIVLSAGVALAMTEVGTNGPDRLVGTAQNDTLKGLSGNDVLIGKGDGDRLFGGAGNDNIYARDGERDVVDCGSGRDVVRADPDNEDRVLSNCERVLKSAGGEGGREDGPNHQ